MGWFERTFPNDTPIELWPQVMERLADRGADPRRDARARRFASAPQDGMRLIDMLVFRAEHDDHHVAKIHELIQSG